MGFFRQFDEIDPLTWTPPQYPFSHLPPIVSRARALLVGRTRQEIVSAAQAADFFIEEYFAGEKDRWVRRVLEKGGWELGYLPMEARDEAGVRELLDNWPPEADDPPPDIPTSENTTEVDALKECIGNYVLDDEDDFPNGKEFEYFAVLALWLVADAMHWLKWTSDPKAMTVSLQEVFRPMSTGVFPGIAAAINKSTSTALGGIPEFVESYQNMMRSAGLSDAVVQISHAGESAICAMDAICYAEHLCESEIQTEELVGLRTQLHQVAQNTEALSEAKAKKRISVSAQKAAIKSHAEHYSMKEDVFAWCAVHLGKYRSMDAAAEAVAGKVVSIKFRTARSWIGEYRKREQSARRL